MIHFGIFKFKKGNVVYAIGRNGYRLLKFEDGEPFELTVYYNPTSGTASDKAVIVQQLKELRTGRYIKTEEVITIFDRPVSKANFYTILCDCVLYPRSLEGSAKKFCEQNNGLMLPLREWPVDIETIMQIEEDFNKLSQPGRMEEERIPKVESLESWMKAYLIER